MPLLNYPTQIAAGKTLMEIGELLVQHGATAVLTEYDLGRQIVAMSFRIAVLPQTEVAYRLPADWQPVLRLLERDRKVPKRLCTKDQAIRVAWRIIKDWLEAQLALVQTRMVSLDQVMLPYAVLPDGQTLYAHARTHILQLPAPDAEPSGTHRRRS